jgi:signal transduction histidine kinase
LLHEEMSQRRVAEKEILHISGREQRRLGEDLHDGLCQTLAGLRLLSSDLKESLKDQGLPSWAEIDRMEGLLGEALTQADAVARGLYPAELETQGLTAALRELAARMSSLYRVSCRFRSAGPVPVGDSAAALHVYRIAQEAVMNAVKSGKARRITVRMSERGGFSALSVTDDGVGLAGSRPRQGMGFKMMSYRARMIGADFAIRSRPGGCTRVTCSFRPESKGG